MDADLEKRISDAVDDGTEAPPSDLAATLREDPDASACFDEVKSLEKRLRAWGFEEPPREYWRNFAPRLASRLGTLPESEEDVLEPPAPDDELPEPEEPPEEVDPLAALAGLVGRSTLPPATAFQEKPGVHDATPDDSVLDIGKLRESAAPPPKDKPEAAAPASREPRGEPAGRPAAGATPTAAPAREEPKSNTMMYVVGILVVALVAVGYFALRNGESGEQTVASNEGAGASSERERRPVASAEPEGEESPVRPAAAPSAEAEGGEAEGGEAEGGEAEGGEAEGQPSAGRRALRPGRPAATASGGGGGAPPPAVSEPAPAPTKAAPSEPAEAVTPRAPEKSGSESLDDLLSGATKAGGPEKRAPSDVVASAVGGGEGSGDDAVPPQPSRSQVRRAMGSVSGQVYACRSLVTSQVRVNATVTVSSSGAVTSVSTSGGAPDVNSCVERAVRGARFPAFREPTFTVTYPFVLSPPEE